MIGAPAIPATMRAMQVSHIGEDMPLRPATQTVPAPAPGEALVQMAAAGVNPADWKACAGFLPFILDSYLPLMPGFDGTGTVVALGDGAGGLAIGDRVAFMSSLPLGRGGTWSDYAVCQAEHAVTLPATLDFTRAATIPVPGISALEALTQGRVASGERVFVNGGSGGTGIFAIQIARKAGAQVAATAGPDNQDLLRHLGVDCAIDYRSEDIAARLARWAPDGVDLLLDTVGQGSLADPAALIRRGGRYVAIETMLPGEALPEPAAFAARQISCLRVSASFETMRAHLLALVEAVGDGTMTAPPVELLPFADAAAALARVRDGHVRGKIVLAVDPHLDDTAQAPATTKDEDQ